MVRGLRFGAKNLSGTAQTCHQARLIVSSGDGRSDVPFPRPLRAHPLLLSPSPRGSWRGSFSPSLPLAEGVILLFFCPTALAPENRRGSQTGITRQQRGEGARHKGSTAARRRASKEPEQAGTAGSQIGTTPSSPSSYCHGPKRQDPSRTTPRLGTCSEDGTASPPPHNQGCFINQLDATGTPISPKSFSPVNAKHAEVKVFGFHVSNEQYLRTWPPDAMPSHGAPVPTHVWPARA